MFGWNDEKGERREEISAAGIISRDIAYIHTASSTHSNYIYNWIGHSQFASLI